MRFCMGILEVQKPVFELTLLHLTSICIIRVCPHIMTLMKSQLLFYTTLLMLCYDVWVLMPRYDMHVSIFFYGKRGVELK